MKKSIVIVSLLLGVGGTGPVLAQCDEAYLVEDANGGYVRPDLEHQIMVAQIGAGYVVRFGYQTTFFADERGRVEQVFETLDSAQATADAFRDRVNAHLACEPKTP